MDVADLFACPDNAAVLAVLRIAPTDRLVRGAPSAYDEGGQLFTRWSRRVPDVTRYTVGVVNLLVHERTARIFAFHRGRLTVAVRTGVTDGRLGGETMDGVVGLHDLGAGWTLYDSDEAEDDDPTNDSFARAYELAGG